MPILSYGCDNFSFEDLNIIEKVRKDFTEAEKKHIVLYTLRLFRSSLAGNCYEIKKMVSFWNHIAVGEEEKFSPLNIYYL